MGLFVAFLLIGSLVFHLLEGWTYLEALYFSFTTLTTIGFGDYLPSTPISKAPAGGGEGMLGGLAGAGNVRVFQVVSLRASLVQGFQSVV